MLSVCHNSPRMGGGQGWTRTRSTVRPKILPSRHRSRPRGRIQLGAPDTECLVTWPKLFGPGAAELANPAQVRPRIVLGALREARSNRKRLYVSSRSFQIRIVSHWPELFEAVSNHRLQLGNQLGGLFERVQKQCKPMRQGRVGAKPVTPPLTAMANRINQFPRLAGRGRNAVVATPLQQKPPIGRDGRYSLRAHITIVSTGHQTYQ